MAPFDFAFDIPLSFVGCCVAFAMLGASPARWLRIKYWVVLACIAQLGIVPPALLLKFPDFYIPHNGAIFYCCMGIWSAGMALLMLWPEPKKFSG